MRNFIDFLHEKRRNPDKNPKIGVVQALEKYKDNPNIYISYTSVDKIGVNPKSHLLYNTPLGIYTYPLKETWSLVKNNQIWFTGKNPAEYIWVLENKNIPVFIHDFVKDYGSSNFKKDMKKLESVTSDKEKFDKVVLEATNSAFQNNFASKFWNITRKIADNPILSKDYFAKGTAMAKWAHILKWLGYSGFSDKSGKSLIHANEPIQAVFLKKDAFKVVEKVLNKYYAESGVWKGGIWESGIWEDGTWKSGTWKNGTWKNGTWEDGFWENGKWENGTWEDGVWENGLWKDGKWENGTWNSGTWWKGVWKGGTWEDGFWDGGTWEFGKWHSGTWNDGAWYDGTWNDGAWYGGKWHMGTWKYGVWDGGTWYNGTWENGTWKYGTWENGTWNNGEWYSGTWKKGWIFSKKFKKFCFSKVNPSKFYELEKKANDITELESMAS